MICQNCSRAGEEHSLHHFKRAAHWHEKCEGCECQHKTGQEYVKVKPSKEKSTLTTSQ